MTNEQKAKEIGNNWYNATCCGVPMDSDRIAEGAALEMAEWKEQQLIEKITDFLSNCPRYLYLNKDVNGDNYFNRELFLKDLLQNIKG